MLDHARYLAVAATLVACKQSGEVRVHQYGTVPAPVVGHGVTLYLGDVEAGRHAEVRVTARNGDILGVGDLEVGDELPFEDGGERYVVRALRYEDHTIDDLGFLRVARQASPSRADVVEIAEGESGRVPGRPDDVITVGAIELDRDVDLGVRVAGGPTLGGPISIGDASHVAYDRGEYSLILVAVMFGPHGDRAIVRFRPGRD